MQTYPPTAQPAQKSTLSPSAYVLLSLPLGILYFIYIVAGIVLSAGLLPIFIGLPIFLGVIMMNSGIMNFERTLAYGVLGLEQPEQAPAYQKPQEFGFFRRLGQVLLDPTTYINMLMIILKFPLGIFNFVVSVIFTCVSIGMMAAPIVYLVLERTMGIDIFERNDWLFNIAPQLTSFQFSFICSGVGLLLLFVSVWLTRALAIWSARLTLAIAPQP